MRTPTAFALATHPLEADPQALLAEVIASGWPKLIVPRQMGGDGADTRDIADALLALSRQHPAAGRLAWSHGLVIAALIRSPNVALREHVLPDLMDGSLAGCVSWVSDFGVSVAPKPVMAEALDRGWHLSGWLEQVLNLQWGGFLVLCPVWFSSPYERPPRLGWTLIRGEEDGLSQEMDRSSQLARQTACGSLRLKNVYFREDELLADDADALSAPLSVLDHTLRAALWSAVPAVSLK